MTFNFSAAHVQQLMSHAQFCNALPGTKNPFAVSSADPLTSPANAPMGIPYAAMPNARPLSVGVVGPPYPAALAYPAGMWPAQPAVRPPAAHEAYHPAPQPPPLSANSQLHVCKWSNCGCVFADAADLLEHLGREHVPRGRCRGPKPTGHECRWEGCGRVSKKRDHLIAHLKCHVKCWMFSCRVCHRNFKHSSGLNRHINRNHGGSSAETPGKGITNVVPQSASPTPSLASLSSALTMLPLVDTALPQDLTPSVSPYVPQDTPQNVPQEASHMMLLQMLGLSSPSQSDASDFGLF
ncbi:hypothetical protein THASP1DRAFT_21688 [Thamnocephalis sphaerospora]|uniref:C2H2-type domain-containing protein n=1 Tax=Thamnocephalis sphaerospora TaxID=78915 RepID=A0A4P9XXA8_9FUNG|nr:hypothetical protein THASP1DRAFT_21688 [Thamnocephalis sphaerospora]|eukprot:RKP10652.1 hypothetical protein THASP1DRAFT_21688 [Thamnocephalis sphaerospora]